MHENKKTKNKISEIPIIPKSWAQWWFAVLFIEKLKANFFSLYNAHWRNCVIFIWENFIMRNEIRIAYPQHQYIILNNEACDFDVC